MQTRLNIISHKEINVTILQVGTAVKILMTLAAGTALLGLFFNVRSNGRNDKKK
jgi:hypothetical protein